MPQSHLHQQLKVLQDWRMKAEHRAAQERIDASVPASALPFETAAPINYPKYEVVDAGTNDDELTIPVVVTFQNFGDEALRILRLVVDPDSGDAEPKFVTLVQEKARIAVNTLAGTVFQVSPMDSPVVLAEYQASSQSDQPVDLQALVEATEKGFWPHDLQLVTRIFKNSTSGKVEIYYVQSQGSPRLYATIQPGDQVELLLLDGNLLELKLDGAGAISYQADATLVQLEDIESLRRASLLETDDLR